MAGQAVPEANYFKAYIKPYFLYLSHAIIKKEKLKIIFFKHS